MYFDIFLPPEKLRLEYIDPEFKEYTTLDKIRDLPSKVRARIVVVGTHSPGDIAAPFAYPPPKKDINYARKDARIAQLQAEVESLKLSIKKKAQLPPLSAPDREGEPLPPGTEKARRRNFQRRDV
jgi:hypothetical protein